LSDKVAHSYKITYRIVGFVYLIWMFLKGICDKYSELNSSMNNA